MDGILASCYASTDHDFAHFMMTAVPFFPGLVEWMFDKETGSNDLFISVSEVFGKWVLPYGHTYWNKFQAEKYYENSKIIKLFWFGFIGHHSLKQIQNYDLNLNFIF